MEEGGGRFLFSSGGRGERFLFSSRGKGGGEFCFRMEEGGGEISKAGKEYKEWDS